MKKLSLLLVLTLFAVLSLVGTALAATPGKPSPKMPSGPMALASPTAFSWGKAARATRYEVRVYKGKTLVLQKTGITKLSWTSSKALPKGVSLTWKVRAGNASGNGAWSQNTTFKVVGIVVGAFYQGGRIGYILQAGDTGYVVGQKHGLIAAMNDQSRGIHWNNGSYGTYVYTGASGRGLGWGPFNTDKIIAAQGPVATSYAAGLARAYRGGGYSDWFLPSSDELGKLVPARQAIFIEFGAKYWTSSEHSRGSALVVDFGGNPLYGANEDQQLFVRAVRAF